jgi:hypothetical protein
MRRVCYIPVVVALPDINGDWKNAKRAKYEWKKDPDGTLLNKLFPDDGGPTKCICKRIFLKNTMQQPELTGIITTQVYAKPGVYSQPPIAGGYSLTRNSNAKSPL